MERHRRDISEVATFAMRIPSVPPLIFKEQSDSENHPREGLLSSVLYGTTMGACARLNKRYSIAGITIPRLR